MKNLVAAVVMLLACSSAYAEGAQTYRPRFDPAPGTYPTVRTVRVWSPTPNSDIYCTTDGSTPTIASTKYRYPFTVTTTTTLRCVAKAWRRPLSRVGSGSFVIQATPAPIYLVGTATATGRAAGAASALSIIEGVFFLAGAAGGATSTGTVELSIVGAASVLAGAGTGATGAEGYLSSTSLYTSPAQHYATASAACAAWPLRQTGTKYYFCSCATRAEAGCVAGSDANAGITPAAPKQTWAAVVSRIGSMAAGDTIALCKGGSWTTTGRNVLQPTQCTTGATAITDPANTGTCDIRDYQASWGGTRRPLITQAADMLFSFQGGSPDDGIRILNLNMNGSGDGSGGVERGTNAIWLYGPHTDYFICNNVIDRFGAALNLQENANGAVSRVIFRGNRVINGVVFGFLGAGNDSQIDANFWDDNGVSNLYDHTIYVSAHYPTSGMSITNNEILFSGTRTDFQGTFLPNAGTQCLGVQLVVHGPVTGLNVENNIVDGGASSGGGCWGIGAGSGGYAEEEYNESMIIRGNVVTRTGHTGIVLDQAQNGVVENNTVWIEQGEGDGIALAKTSTNLAKDRPQSNVTARNNTVYITGIGNGTGKGIRSYTEGTGYVLSNNSVMFSTTGATCYSTGGTYTFAGNNACYNGVTHASVTVTTNPLFTSAPTNFTPQLASPLNGAGSNTYKSATDINLKVRPSPPAIGAVER